MLVKEFSAYWRKKEKMIPKDKFKYAVYLKQKELKRKLTKKELIDCFIMADTGINKAKLKELLKGI